MAEGLLLELEKVVTRLTKSESPAFADDHEDAHRLCVVLEQILRFQLNQRSLFGGKKDYWDYILPSFKGEPFVALIQGSPISRTNVGKGRVFLRHALAHKSLGELLQIVSINTKLVKDWYGEQAVMRNEALTARFLDQLYHLSAVRFDFEPDCLGLDEQWPKPAASSTAAAAAASVASPSAASPALAERHHHPDGGVHTVTSTASLPATPMNVGKGSHEAHHQISSPALVHTADVPFSAGDGHETQPLAPVPSSAASAAVENDAFVNNSNSKIDAANGAEGGDREALLQALQEENRNLLARIELAKAADDRAAEQLAKLEDTLKTVRDDYANVILDIQRLEAANEAARGVEESLQQLVGSKDAQLTEVQARLADLESQSTSALAESAAKDARIADLERASAEHMKRIREQEEALRQASSASSDTAAELGRVRDSHAQELAAVKSNLEQHHAASVASLTASFAEKHASVSGEQAAVLLELSRVKDALVSAEQQVQGKDKELEALKNAHRHQEEEWTLAQEQSHLEVQRLQAIVKDRDLHAEVAKAEHQGILERLEQEFAKKLATEQEAWQARLDPVREELSTHMSTNEKMQAAHTALGEELQRERHRADTAATQSEVLTKECESLRAVQREGEGALRAHVQELEAKVHELQSLSDAAVVLSTQQLSDAKARIQSLEKSLADAAKALESERSASQQRAQELVEVERAGSEERNKLKESQSALEAQAVSERAAWEAAKREHASALDSTVAQAQAEAKKREGEWEAQLAASEAKSREEKELLSANLAALQSQLAEEKVKSVDSSKMVIALQQRIEQLERRLVDVDKEHGQRMAELETMWTAKLASAEKAKAMIEQQMADVLAARERGEASDRALEESLSAMRAAYAEQQRTLEEASQQATNLAQQLRSIESALSEERQRHEVVRLAHVDLKKSHGTLLEQRAALEAKMVAQTAAAELREKEWEAERSSLSANERDLELKLSAAEVARAEAKKSHEAELTRLKEELVARHEATLQEVQRALKAAEARVSALETECAEMRAAKDQAETQSSEAQSSLRRALEEERRKAAESQLAAEDKYAAMEKQLAITKQEMEAQTLHLSSLHCAALEQLQVKLKQEHTGELDALRGELQQQCAADLAAKEIALNREHSSIVDVLKQRQLELEGTIKTKTDALNDLQAHVQNVDKSAADLKTALEQESQLRKNAEAELPRERQAQGEATAALRAELKAAGEMRERLQSMLEKQQAETDQERAMKEEQNSIVQQLQVSLKSKEADLASQRAAVQDQLQAEKAKSLAMESSNSELKKQIEEQLALNRTQAEEACAKLRFQLETLSKENEHVLAQFDNERALAAALKEKLQQQEAVHGTLLTDLNDQLESANQSLASLMAERDGLHSALVMAQAEKASALAELTSMGESLDSVRADRSALQQQLQASEEDKDQLGAQLFTLRAEAESAKASQNDALALVSTKEAELKIARSGWEDAKQALAMAKKIKDQLETDLQARSEDVKRISDELAKQHAQRLAAVESEKSGLGNQVESLQARVSELEAELGALKATKAEAEGDAAEQVRVAMEQHALAQAQSAKLLSQLDDRQRQLKLLTQSHSETLTTLNRVKEELGNVKHSSDLQISILQRELAAAQENVTGTAKEHQATAESLIKEAETAKADAAAKDERIAELRSMLAELQEGKQVREASEAAVRETLADREGRISALESEISTLKHQKDEHARETQALRQQWLAAQAADAAKVETLVAEMQRTKADLATTAKAAETLRASLVETQTRFEDEAMAKEDAVSAVLRLKEEMGVLLPRCLAAEQQSQTQLQDIASLRIELIARLRDKEEMFAKIEDLREKVKRSVLARWQDSDDVSNCTGCRAGFSVLRRKHHCRSCGQIFCDDCANIFIETTSAKDKQRVCKDCNAFISSLRKD